MQDAGRRMRRWSGQKSRNCLFGFGISACLQASSMGTSVTSLTSTERPLIPLDSLKNKQNQSLLSSCLPVLKDRNIHLSFCSATIP